VKYFWAYLIFHYRLVGLSVSIFVGRKKPKRISTAIPHAEEKKKIYAFKYYESVTKWKSHHYNKKNTTDFALAKLTVSIHSVFWWQTFIFFVVIKVHFLIIRIFVPFFKRLFGWFSGLFILKVKKIALKCLKLTFFYEVQNFVLDNPAYHFVFD
jgi:uncharacterized membrane protein required for colicin V production